MKIRGLSLGKLVDQRVLKASLDQLLTVGFNYGGPGARGTAGRVLAAGEAHHHPHAPVVPALFALESTC
jgi:hypothetical protein